MLRFDERLDKMTAKTLIFLIFATSCVTGRAWATYTSWAPTTDEIRTLPPYCQARFNAAEGSPERHEWEQRIGKNFLDIHHYCAGINAIRRYWRATDPRDRGLYLEQAMSQWNYMVKALKPDFPLGAELFSNRGDTYVLMGRTGNAIGDFNHAIAIDPNVIKPYLQLANLYVSLKRKTSALETVTEGLRHSPKSKALQGRYLELGGITPFPKPLVEEAAKAEGAQQTETAAVPQTSPQTAASDKPAPSVSEPPPVPQEKAHIGTPTNPYCRFCPPD